jgi:hypothetical protein
MMTAVLCRFAVEQITVEGGAFIEFYIFYSVHYDSNVMM